MSRTPRKPHAPEAAPEPAPKRHRRHDQSYKKLFGQPRAAAALIRDFAAKGWAHELDMTTLQPFPTETVGPERVLSVLRSNKTLLDPGGAVPLVLAFVLYNGPHPWNAATTMSEWARRHELSSAVARAVAGMEVRHSYRVLDLQRAFAQDLLPEDGLLHWLAALERDPWPNFPHVHRSMARQWGGADCLAVRQAFAKWVVERMGAPDVPAEVLDEIKERIKQPTEAEEMGQTYTEWVESTQPQVLERGIKRGSATMLVRLAGRRFGAETAEKLAGLVRAMGAEQLARVGDAVVDCNTGDELLEAARNGATVTANDMGHETGHDTAL